MLGAVVAGILEEFLPQQAITKFLPKAVFPAVMIGACLGLDLPDVRVRHRGRDAATLRKGLPLSCCIAYMLAGPIINVVVIFSTWVAFRDHKIGPEMVGLRVGLGFVVACVTGLVVHVQYLQVRELAADAARDPVRTRHRSHRTPYESRSRPGTTCYRSEQRRQQNRREAPSWTGWEHLRHRPSRLRGHHRLPDSRGRAGGDRQASRSRPIGLTSPASSRSSRSRR